MQKINRLLAFIPFPSTFWLVVLSSGIASPTLAQTAPITTAPDGTNTQVTQQQNNFQITGGQISGDGANLFHSFQQFGLSESQIANFISNPAIKNILGRIVGGDASIINGLIQVTGSNSNLFLINPSGIIFGPNAQLNVPGSFTATTATGISFGQNIFHTIGNNNWSSLVGNPSGFYFPLQAGSIINAGNLTVAADNNISLIGGNVINTGAINAPGGNISIAAIPGKNLIRISQAGHLLNLEIGGDFSQIENGIIPAKIPQLLTGSQLGNAVGLAVLADGSVQLTATGNPVPIIPGTTIVSGHLNASGNRGGEINILGKQVGLINAQVSANGSLGGGTVLIGGDYQGLGVVPNAARTFVSPDSIINADAIDSGNGGRVIVWADEITRFYGNITASGVVNGGFVEVSGKQSLDYQGLVDLRSTSGQVGTLLLDPTDITISTAVDSPTISNANGTFSDPTNSSSNLNTTTLQNQLGLSNVVVTTESALSALGNITVSDPIAWSNGNSLTLTANNNITINNSIVNSGNGAIALQANNTIAVNANLTTQGGNITLSGNTILGQSAIALTTTGTMQSGNINFNGTLNGTVSNTNDLTINAGTGNITFSSAIGDSIALGNLTINSTGNTVFSSNITNVSKLTTTSPQTSTSPPPSKNNSQSASNNTPSDSNTSESSVISKENNNSDTGESSSSSGENSESSSNNKESNSGEFSSDIEIGRENLSESFDAGNIESAIPQIEVLTQQEYQDYLGAGLSLGSAANSAQSIKEVLTKIEKKTGNRSAIIYAIARSDQLELVLITTNSKIIHRSVREANRILLVKTAKQFRDEITNPRKRYTTTYLEPAQKLYNWLIKPLEAELESEKIETLLFSLDAGLRTLPVAALHDGKQFLVEKYSLSLIPSMSLTNTNYQSLSGASVLAMGASLFADKSPLPSVPLELKTIISTWPGKSFLNEDFTLKNLKSVRSTTPYQIIHLATHGEFKPGTANNSYIQLWDTQLQLNQMRELGWSNPPVELLVLSACRTAVGDEKAELGFGGLAVQAGVKSALASLWYVSDQGTLGLMSEFYSQLRNADIKSEALRQAQIAMLQGKTKIESGQLHGPSLTNLILPSSETNKGNITLSHPYYWSGFTIIGSPW